ncbi:hypothetical protein, partial [Comamonas sp.]|uniref:hypothetical protein n=1 Tax=Comamonas sp. TaxID=34028 RepID=UPI002FCAC184
SDEFVFVLRGGVFCRRRGVLFSHEKRAPATSAGLSPQGNDGRRQGLRSPKAEILSFLPRQRRTAGQSAGWNCGMRFIGSIESSRNYVDYSQNKSCKRLYLLRYSLIL